MSFDGLTGEEVADIAYDQSSIKPDGLGLAIEILIYVFTILCTVVVGLRIWVRTIREDSKQPWKIADWLALFGFIPFIPASVLGVLAVRFGIGASDKYLDQFEMKDFILVRGKEYLMLYELIYYGSSSLTKYAIAFTILNICMRRRYAYAMYAIMGLMATSIAGCLVYFFVNCRPIMAYWNPKIGECMSPEQGFLVMSYIGTAVQVVADWSCAITPFFIVWSLQMPRRAKISVVCVLGLGILASIAALMRIVSYKYIDTRYYPKDHMIAQGRLVLWSVFESGFAIIACSLPPLKKLVSGLIGRSFGRTTDPSRPSRLAIHAETPLHSLTPHGQTRTTVSGKAKWDRLDDDDSAKHIIKATEVSVERGSVTV